MIEIIEGCESYVDYTALDESMDLVTPTSMRYRIDCLTTGETILEWTSVESPSSSGTIVVTSQQNRIINPSNRRERRQMVVETTSGSSIRNDPKDWMVKNIQGIR